MNNITKETFHNIIRQCSEKLHITRDDDMYTFYLGMRFLKKAIDQADASIQMDLTDEEAKDRTYREKADNNLCLMEKMFQDYVCDIKGFDDVSYYHCWLREMEHVAEIKTEWSEKARRCGSRLHSFVFASTI